MARALMTPDELRRLDNDLCIIFEKGIKPIKAQKYYYFKHPMIKDLEKEAISHNDIGEINRGTWRKYNPYNPYVEEKEEEKKQDLKVESLDDLFEEEPETNKEETNKEETNNQEKEIKKEEQKIEPLNLKSFNDAPILPQDEDEEYDLQKELEAKFDELFGPIDETNGDGQ